MSTLGLSLSSRAMWGSWCYHQPSRTAFDCGEGLSLHLTSRIFAIERVCLSHADADHVGGLFSLIGLRAKTKGDTTKALTIYHPSGDVRFDRLRNYAAASWPDLPYTLTWVPIEAGHVIPVSRDSSIVSFHMDHRPNTPTLGYRLNERRTRLKPEYRDHVRIMASADVGLFLRDLRAGGIEPNEVYDASGLAYCLDHWRLDSGAIAGATMAIMDVTFLDGADRDTNDVGHATLAEAIDTCVKAGVKTMVSAHRSVRYHPDDLQHALDKLSPPSTLSIIQCPTEGVITL